jgi:aspartate aminotransferase-like enzyme
MAERTHRCAEERGDELQLSVLARPGSRSDTVTTLRLGGGLTGADVVRAVAARGFTVGGGYGALREHTFRIGHMGDHTVEGLERCLEACEGALKELVRVR